MMGAESVALGAALWLTAFFLFFGAFFGLLRLLIGPHLADRVVALDFLSFVAVATITVLTIHFQQSKYLDVAILLALLSFLATVAFARYAHRRQQQGAGLEALDD